MTYKTSYQRTVSYTPKGMAAEQIWQFCKHEKYDMLSINPQNVVRDALEKYNITPKHQPGCGDRSWWEPGKAIKLSLWNENADALSKAAEQQGTTKQIVIEQAVMAFISGVSH